MLTDQFKHEINSYMKRQGDKLLAKQHEVARNTYSKRSGRLLAALGREAAVGDCRLDLPYPVHIRFLDMKRISRGRKRNKSVYAPIYNKYVYGYVVSPVRRMLMAYIPKQMVRIIESNIEDIRSAK